MLAACGRLPSRVATSASAGLARQLRAGSFADSFFDSQVCQPALLSPGVQLPQTSPLGARHFGTKRVRQRRRSRGRIIQLKESHYEPKPEGYQPLPLSLLASGPIRRVLSTRTQEAQRLAGCIDWERYKCDVKGVRWHACGGWRVQFDKRDYEHNFFVKCSCYFRVQVYGFDKAKELAIAYRRRLEAEWDEQQQIWAKLDEKRELERTKRRAEREQQALQSEDFEDIEVSIWGDKEEHASPANLGFGR
eukprot:TRINITY_DN9964_c0_g1_i1.p1 TRINITY_DN9964_c0_g1~~TRINITY_DN9964_c0_g1_i1.p1  ORF type:complete len:248 (-),score=48.35 TRINITY_DN9964_c0_g1_i1:128-871(-)